MKYNVFTNSFEKLNVMRKKITLLTTLCFFLITFIVKAQTPPNKFNYRAVAHNSAGLPIASTTISIQMTILKSSPTGTPQYSESHFVNTDSVGAFNLVIGSGIVQSGSMTSIDWSNDNYFLKVDMDTAGGTNFQTMGATQFLSVPYALYAKSAESLSGVINETDPMFGASIANGITGADTTNWNNKQNHLIAGSNITISGDTISKSFSINGSFTHYIGEEFGGGVIFHVLKNLQGEEHGLIVDKTFLSTNHSWSNIGYGFCYAGSRFNGLDNSINTIFQSGHTNSAAALCLNSTNGGESDWYLPSIEELRLLQHNFRTVTKTLSQIPGATQLLINNYYWSSTEVSPYEAFYADFQLGSPRHYTNKNNMLFVRAIRAF
jgi:hypothetical protein